MEAEPRSAGRPLKLVRGNDRLPAVRMSRLRLYDRGVPAPRRTCSIRKGRAEEARDRMRPGEAIVGREIHRAGGGPANKGNETSSTPRHQPGRERGGPRRRGAARPTGADPRRETLSTPRGSSSEASRALIRARSVPAAITDLTRLVRAAGGDASIFKAELIDMRDAASRHEGVHAVSGPMKRCRRFSRRNRARYGQALGSPLPGNLADFRRTPPPPRRRRRASRPVTTGVLIADPVGLGKTGSAEKA